MNRFGFVNLGQYFLITSLITTCAIYYANSNNLKRLNNTTLVTGKELNTTIQRNAVAVIATLTRVIFRETSTTAVLSFKADDGYIVEALLPTNLSLLNQANLQIGQAYKISGTPITRGVLSLRSLDQLEVTPNRELDKIEVICFKNNVQITKSIGYGTLCNSSEVINYTTSVAIKNNQLYTGYWTEQFNTRERVFNIIGFVN